MMQWQTALLFFAVFGCLSILLAISKQLDRLIKEISHLRIEHRRATGVEPAGLILARDRAEADRM